MSDYDPVMEGDGEWVLDPRGIYRWHPLPPQPVEQEAS